LQFLVGQQWLVLIDAAGETLFVHRNSKRTKPEEIESSVAEGKQILANFFEAQNSVRPAIPPPMPASMPS
jgi:hypothetical protein